MGIIFIENNSVFDLVYVFVSELFKVLVDMYMILVICYMCIINMLLICSMNLKVK